MLNYTDSHPGKFTERAEPHSAPGFQELRNRHGLGEKRMGMGWKRELRPFNLNKEQSLQPQHDSILLRSLEDMDLLVFFVVFFFFSSYS